MENEGYIKFNLKFEQGNPPNPDFIHDLNDFRTKLYKLGLIGVYESGIGFGNVSKRIIDKEFIISGSATGNIEVLSNLEYATVTEVNIKKNTVYSYGKIPASSETLSHAAVYLACESINYVVHIHSLELWELYLNKFATTPIDNEFGTPEIAFSIYEIVKSNPEYKIIILGGHKEGLLLWGESLYEIENNINMLLRK